MNRLSVAIALGLGCAVLVASGFEGRVATGIVSGYLFGASIGALGTAWQSHMSRTKPEKMMTAFAVSFGFKLVGVMIGAFALAYISAVARVADWRSFIIAYAVAALICLLVGAYEIARSLRTVSPVPPVRGETA